MKIREKDKSPNFLRFPDAPCNVKKEITPMRWKTFQKKLRLIS
jgi:hypothetical protein